MCERQPIAIEQGVKAERGPLSNKLVIDMSSAAAGRTNDCPTTL